MRFTDENLRELKVLFSESIGDLVENETFMCKVISVVKEHFVAEIESLKQQNEDLQRENQLLNKKIDGLEQYSRRNNIRIFGLDEEKEENVEQKVLATLKDNMGISVLAEQIDRCHRVGARKKNGKHPRPVIMKFLSYKTKEEILKNRNKLKAAKTLKIGIQEDLTASNYKLFKEACKKFGNRQCWTRDGRIFARNNDTKLIIRDISDLDVEKNNKVSLIDASFSLSQ
ncbi:uncharacterized protein [Onthophagus taurus]|uniref:uncharacterized protein n=1 Tax=Onthophagus taurus TaxID=166361 RepID=UPI0039BE35BF